MKSRKFWSFALSVLIGSVISAGVLSLSTGRAVARPAVMPVDGSIDDVELFRMFENDQTDRLAVVEGSKTEAQIRQAAEDRIQQVRGMVRNSKVHSAQDFYRAAAIIQHGRSQDDILMAHDLSLTAISLGAKQAAAIAASTEDRFLLAQGMKQRYGTQYRQNGSKVDLAPVGDGVTDTMRREMGLPQLSEAKANSAAFSPNP